MGEHATSAAGTNDDREYGDLTERQRTFFEMAAAHSDDFATRAAEHDREGTFPYENHEEMHESGYARLTMPGEFGGSEATLEEFCIAQERLAHGCGSTALGANMHGFFLGVLAEQWRASEEGPLGFMMGMVRDQKLTLGAAISERGSSSPFTHPSGTVERVEGGYKLNGEKVFGSNSAVSPAFMFNGVLEENGERRVLSFQVPRGTPGAELIEEWDTLGMRGTASYPAVFKDCVVPEMMLTGEGLEGAPVGENLFAGQFVCWFEPSVGAVYTGIATAARNLARESVANRTRRPFGEVRHYASTQYGLGEMYIAIEASRAFIRRSAQRLGDPGWRDQGAMALAIATKQLATENAKRVVDMAMEVTGGGAFSRKMPLERLYRDARAGTFHPPHGYDALEAIGKADLGIPTGVEPRFL